MKRTSKKRIKKSAIISVIILLAAIIVGCLLFENENEPDNYDPIIKSMIDYDYPEEIIELYRKNEEARDFAVSYRKEKDIEHTIDLSEYENSDAVPLFLQWDKRWGYTDYGGECVGISGCGPVCLSMAGYYLTRDEDTFSPDNVIDFSLKNGYCIKNGGSDWLLMSEGAEKLGLESEILPLSENIIIENLEKGNPVILIMGPGNFTSSGHFIVLCDYKDGKYKINDPNSIKRSEKLWSFSDFSDEIRNIWAISV